MHVQIQEELSEILISSAIQLHVQIHVTKLLHYIKDSLHFKLQVILNFLDI